MGERKRRQETLGDGYGNPQEETVFLNFTRSQIQVFYEVVTKSTWYCIGGVAVFWVVFRVGVAQGWWG